jgi:hypothetical protein
MKRQEARARGKRLRDDAERSSRKDDSAQNFAPIDPPPDSSSVSSNPRPSYLRGSQQYQSMTSNPAGPAGESQPPLGFVAAPPGKVAIPALKTSRAINPTPNITKKGRIAHACDNCRKAKSGCTGEMPCLKCKNAGLTCVYGDGKRDKDRK